MSTIELREKLIAKIRLVDNDDLLKEASRLIDIELEDIEPKERPWIKINNAISAELIEQVAKCPSGALSIKKD